MFKISSIEFDEKIIIQKYFDAGFVSWFPRYKNDISFIDASDQEAFKHVFVKEPLLFGYAENLWGAKQGPLPEFYFKNPDHYSNRRLMAASKNPKEYDEKIASIKNETELLRISEYKLCSLSQNNATTPPITFFKKVMSDSLGENGFFYCKSLSIKSHQAFAKEIAPNTWMILVGNAIWPTSKSLYRSNLIIEAYIANDIKNSILKNTEIFPFHFDALNPVSFYYREFGNNSELEISIRAKIHYYKIFMNGFEEAFASSV